MQAALFVGLETSLIVVYTSFLQACVLTATSVLQQLLLLLLLGSESHPARPVTPDNGTPAGHTLQVQSLPASAAHHWRSASCLA
jgi:hypothetical protein